MSGLEKMRAAGERAQRNRAERATVSAPEAAVPTHAPFGAAGTTPEERAARREASAGAMEQIAASEKGDQPRRRRGPGGGHGHGPGRMMPGAKAKDFKGTMKRMIRFMSRFKVALVIVFLFAIGSTVFNIVGPKVLSQATTELFNGIAAKIAGTGGINYDAVAGILIATLALYLVSAACSFVQGWMMSAVSQRTCYQMRRDIAEKIDRMPMGDLAGTVLLLVQANPKMDIRLDVRVNENSYSFDTREVRQVLGDDVPLDLPEVSAWMQENLTEGIEALHGGM